MRRTAQELARDCFALDCQHGPCTSGAEAWAAWSAQGPNPDPDEQDIDPEDFAREYDRLLASYTDGGIEALRTGKPER